MPVTLLVDLPLYQTADDAGQARLGLPERKPALF
jgi:hypothetical protein